MNSQASLEMFGTCRMYEKKFPSERELVVCEVVEIRESECYLKILEYNNILGMLTFTNLTRVRQRSAISDLHIGLKMVLEVLRVDESSGYVDLDKRTIRKADENLANDRFIRNNSVQTYIRSFLCKLKERHVAELAKQGIRAEDDNTFNITLEDVYRRVIWPAVNYYVEKFQKRNDVEISDEKAPDALSILQDALNDFDGTFSAEVLEDGFPEEWKEDLCAVLKQKLQPKPVRVVADIKVYCYTMYRGINVIKDVLLAGEEYAKTLFPNENFEIKLQAAPIFNLSVTMTSPAIATKNMAEVMRFIKSKARELGAVYEVSREPTVLEKESKGDQE